ncbi:hypothetical protein AB0952_22930 [Streptomyces caniferus]|uniref:WXG100 family type VII secretion target n=1 Tax=Streptomyces caniferus TaxID=285557 RepID=UPI003454E309
MAEHTVGLGIMGCTDFEKSSHQALYDMVADADHLQIVVMGADLVDAGKEIARITDDLEAYAQQTRAHWKGEGAQAFDDWTRETAAESRKLGHYAKNTGEAMVDAATALGQAKLMPKPPALRNFVETDTSKPNGVTALTKDPAREDAIAEMNRLASYYRTAQEKIAGQEVPNFRPASGFVPEPKPTDGYGDEFYLLDDPAGGQPGTGSGGTATTTSPDRSDGEHQVGASPSASHEAQRDQQIGTSVDSTAPVATHNSPPSHGNASLPHGGSSQNAPDSGAPVWRPSPGRAAAPAERGIERRIPQSETGRPNAAQGRTGRAPADGIVGSTQRRDAEAGRRKLPSGPVMGEEPGMASPRPVGSRGNLPGPGGGTPGRERGGAGEHLASPRGDAMNKPRGSVMGEERGSVAHGVTGGGSQGAGSFGARGTGTHAAQGRRLAYERGGPVVPGAAEPVMGSEQRSRAYGSASGNSGSGGTAGGVLSGTPTGESRGQVTEPGGRPGQAQASRNRTGEFTSGGSGLARNKPSSGVLPATGAPSSGRRRGTSAQRPDYLLEESETWTARQTPVVPPVIE